MKILWAGAALIGAMSNVQAQEATWDGWFGGFDAGYINRTITIPGIVNDSFGGPTIGVVGGHWWQVDLVTLGFDAGVSFGGANRSTTEVLPPPFPATIQTSLSEVATVTARAKIGAPVGNVLVYAAAGVQYVHRFQQSSLTSPGFSSNNSASGTDSGWVAALGTEYKIASNISLKGEVGINSFWSMSGIDQHGGYHAKVGLNYYFD